MRVNCVLWNYRHHGQKYFNIYLNRTLLPNVFRYENDRPKYYIPPRPQKQPDIPEDWGLYGGSYGTGTGTLEYQGYGNRHTYNYWGFNKFQGEKGPTTGLVKNTFIVPIVAFV